MDAKQTGKKKILIADDEPFLRKLVSRTLGTDYIVLEAENGEEAVMLARSQAPDLILMDVMMPVKDGITALHEIRADRRTREIPVVMLTGSDYSLNRDPTSQMGVAAYVIKPVRLQELLDIVSRVLEGVSGT